MLIILETGRRNLHQIFIEQSANPDGALQRFMAAVGTELQHVADMHHVAITESTQRFGFFAYQQIGGAIIDQRALMADFS